MTDIYTSGVEVQVLGQGLPELRTSGLEVQMLGQGSPELRVSGFELQVMVGTRQKAKGGYFQVHRYPLFLPVPFTLLLETGDTLITEDGFELVG